MASLYTCICQIYCTTCWCSEVNGDIPLIPKGPGLYLHKPPPHQVVYLAYTPPNHGLYVHTFKGT